ncbi:hypothetical protein CBM2634_B190008 [Cupriavidus taiwanensis]|uniref:Uncharacterized protein n=1 Tax=Cupriavidus taiwanensis TaxID=164546 RepID=A0A375J7N6_9BURK|nr:hypothetical protein CBM2634_B190008 [Cupriavidus taiwanensis]
MEKGGHYRLPEYGSGSVNSKAESESSNADIETAVTSRLS